VRSAYAPLCNFDFLAFQKKIKPKMRGTWGGGTYQYFGRKCCQLREARRNLVDG